MLKELLVVIILSKALHVAATECCDSVMMSGYKPGFNGTYQKDGVWQGKTRYRKGATHYVIQWEGNWFITHGSNDFLKRYSCPEPCPCVQGWQRYTNPPGWFVDNYLRVECIGGPDTTTTTPAPTTTVEKQFGNWANAGECEAAGTNSSCGPGLQTQIRNCTDGTTDKCTDADTNQNISCADAGTGLRDCPKLLGDWVNTGECKANGTDSTCGPGLQTQTRNCTDGTTDL